MNKMKSHRVFPTLDMFIDVKAKDKEDAISKVLNDKEVLNIINDCCNQLSEIGYQIGGCDMTYATDTFEEDEDE